MSNSRIDFFKLLFLTLKILTRILKKIFKSRLQTNKKKLLVDKHYFQHQMFYQMNFSMTNLKLKLQGFQKCSSEFKIK